MLSLITDMKMSLQLPEEKEITKEKKKPSALTTTQVGFDSHNCVKKKGIANMFVTTVDARLLFRSAPHDRHRALVTQIKRCQNAGIKKE